MWGRGMKEWMDGWLVGWSVKEGNYYKKPY